jgi:aryl-alcohol dehydrogenase-like predicted oxidoreductase
LLVTTLSYGAMELRNDARGRPVSDEQADRLLNATLDAGINLIDTSIDYGLSEERIGRFISHRRSEYFLATKCGCPLQPSSRDMSASPSALLRRSVGHSPLGTALRSILRGRLGVGGDDHVFTRDNIVAGVEQSLFRLKTDYIDILQVHHAPSRAELETFGIIETLQDLKQQGKVRFIGVSSALPNVAGHTAMGVFDTIQLPYSAFRRDYEATLADAVAAGAGTIVRGSQRRGDVQRGTEIQALWRKAVMAGPLDDITRMEFYIRFTLDNPHVNTLLIGTTDVGHLNDNVNAVLKGPLPAAVRDAAL